MGSVSLGLRGRCFKNISSENLLKNAVVPFSRVCKLNEEVSDPIYYCLFWALAEKIATFVSFSLFSFTVPLSFPPPSSYCGHPSRFHPLPTFPCTHLRWWSIFGWPWLQKLEHGEQGNSPTEESSGRDWIWPQQINIIFFFLLPKAKRYVLWLELAGWKFRR